MTLDSGAPYDQHMKTVGKMDLSRYSKNAQSKSLIDKVTVPVTPETKARVRAIKDRIDVNAFLRDALEQLLSQAS